MSSQNKKDNTLSQYRMETKLAEQLRNSTRMQRRNLYSRLYDDFLKVYPDAFIPGQNPGKEVSCIRKFINPETEFLEIGPGDGHFSEELLKYTRHVTTIEIGEDTVSPAANGINKLFFNGVEMNLPGDRFDVAYSNQVLEHLHPDDISEHLDSIRQSLTSGGRYIAITPHRFCGPHDVSRHFDHEARGWHLHEYTYGELIGLGQRNGYNKAMAYYQRNRYSLKLGNRFILGVEKCLSVLPYSLRKPLGRIFMPSIMMVFEK